MGLKGGGYLCVYALADPFFDLEVLLVFAVVDDDAAGYDANFKVLDLWVEE